MEMYNQIGVCMVVHNSFWETRYCIENLLAKTNYKFKWYIIDNGSTDNRLTEYCQNLINNQMGYFHRFDKVVSMATAMNQALRPVGQEYCVIFPPNCLVNETWLESLYHYHQLIDNAGCLSIRNGTEDLHWMPIIHKSMTDPEFEMKNVLTDANNFVDGVMMFKRELLNETGLLDEHLKFSGFEFIELAFRTSIKGLYNAYIRKQTLIRLNLQNEVICPKKSVEAFSEFKAHVNAMFKKKMFVK